MGRIKMDLKVTRLQAVDWITLAKKRDKLWAVVSTVMNVRSS